MQFPSPNPNVDALFISLNVVIIWSNLRSISKDLFIENRFKRINSRFDRISEHTDLTIGILKGQTQTNELLSKQIIDTKKLLEKREKKNSRNKIQ